MEPNARIMYPIPDDGWNGLFWPKTGCDDSGQNCAVGQSVQPCPNGGCQPPSETRVEFFYPPMGDPRTIYYDVSLVDGYTLPMEIIPIPEVCAIGLETMMHNVNPSLETIFFCLLYRREVHVSRQIVLCH